MVHLVVGIRQVAEFLRAGHGQLLVPADMVHRVQQRPHAQAVGQQQELEHADALHHDQDDHPGQAPAHAVFHVLPHLVGVFRQGVHALLHVRADAALLGVIVGIVHQQPGLGVFLLRAQRPVLFRQLHRPDGFRDILIPAGFQHQAHGVVFPVHQVHGLLHGRLQLGQRRGVGRVFEHHRQGLLPPAVLLRLPEIVLQVGPLAHHGIALDLLRQVVGGVHQVIRRRGLLNIVARRRGQAMEGVHRPEGGHQQDHHDHQGNKEHKHREASQRNAPARTFFPQRHGFQPPV